MAYEKGPIKTGKSPKTEKGDGRVYAGGTPDFNESTGLYRPGSPNEYLNPKPRKPKPSRPGRPVPKPLPGRKGPGGKRQSEFVQNEKLPIKRIKPGIGKKPVNPRGPRPGRPTPKPLPKPGKQNPKRPSKRNDIIRNMIKPDGTRALRTSGRILPSQSKGRGGK